MRFAIFLLITSLFIVSYGCSKEEPYEPEKKSISIWEGETSHISIETDLTHCNCALQSEDQEIATATIDKTGICITTHKSGSTMIRLLDNDKILCEIFVYVKYFSSPEIIDWGIPLKEGSPGYPGITIKATDLRIPPEIEKELREESEPFIGATYTFNQDTRKFTIKTFSEVSYEGSYEWNLTSLTLMYDGKKEKYGFKFATGMSHGYIIEADKTEKYQRRYPDAGITEVKVNHVWKNNGIIPPGGIIFD
ncbi:hypothetical protein [Bacteroides acidifaciens]|uniref:hypothetical protein n=1 Tax=Bacteroides acidifaciens TaxID=85831 RepID=UPI0025AF1F2F|nr:hypothetical protein [Bacteroides acidifaciens]